MGRSEGGNSTRGSGAQASLAAAAIFETGALSGLHCQYHSLSRWQLKPLLQQKLGQMSSAAHLATLPPHWP
jgi:hypothetical protein